MQRTQISLGDDERRILDEEAARTGRSLSSLIREAVTAHYGQPHDLAADVAAIEASIGAWRDREEDGEQYVERLRSGRRLREAAE